MAATVRKEKYVSVDLSNNSNKVWIGEVLDDGTFRATWGRVGGTMQSKPEPMGSVEAANRQMDSKIADKLKGKIDKKTGMKTRYEKVDLVEDVDAVPTSSSASVRPVAKTALASTAKRQIEYSDPLVGELIERLAKENVHNILNSTKLSYDDTTGLFATPLGVVTRPVIDEARTLLVTLGDFVANNDFDNPSFISTLEQYMRRIPQDLGYKRISPRVVMPDLPAVQQQGAILDSLEASLKMVESGATKKNGTPEPEEAKLFDVALELVVGGNELDGLRKLYRETRKDAHTCSHLDVKRAFRVDIKVMRESFEKKGLPVGSVKRLWHGTRTSNLLSILKGGLIIPPTNASNVTGRLYGNGVYFASASTKSLNYAYGYWGGGSRDDNCFMFLADVALGKHYTPRSGSESLPKAGYDSTWAVAGRSGVYNDEFIVYKVNQCNLVYLLEFTRGGR